MDEYVEGGYSTKIFLLGDNGVGKSTILANIIYGKTKLPKNEIIYSKIFEKNDGTGEKLQINFWDTINKENFNSIMPMYYKNAQAAIIVFDISNRSSFEKLDEIMNKVKEFAHKSIIIFLVGNKKDLEINGKRIISKEEAEKYAESVGAFYIEVSALKKEGIEDLLNIILNNIPKPSEDNQVFRLYRVQPLQKNFCEKVTCGAR